MDSARRIEELRQKFHENPRRYFAPLANEYRRTGDAEQAIAICRAHLSQQPAHMSGHVVLGQALFDAGRTAEARTVFEQALTLDPENSVALRYLGDIARKDGDVAGARTWYSRALENDPTDAEAAAYLAELNEPEMMQPVQEISSVAARPEESPPADEVSDDAAPPEAHAAPESFETRDDSRLPVADAATDATQSPVDSPFVTRTMAELYARQGYRSAALDVYQQLADRNPDDLEIQERIRELMRGGTPSRVEPVTEAPGGAATSTPDSTARESVEQDTAEPESVEPAPVEQIRIENQRVEDQRVEDQRAEQKSVEASAALDAQTGELADAETSTSGLDDAMMQADGATSGGDHDSTSADAPAVTTSAEATIEGELSPIADEQEDEVVVSAGQRDAGGPPAEQPPEVGLDALDTDWLAPYSHAGMAAHLGEPVPEQTSAAETSRRHFTETELGLGDSWDTDPWGAGFSPEEDVSASSAGFEPRTPDQFDDAIISDGFDLPDSSHPSFGESSGEATAAVEEPQVSEDPADAAPAEEAAYGGAEFGPQSGNPGAVQPEDSDVFDWSDYPHPAHSASPQRSAARPHTVREFFAVLGNAKPRSSRERTTSSSAQGLDSFFGNTHVSSADDAAAAALRDAFAGAADPGAPPAESEEDVRRFRQWLDSLTKP